MLSVISLLMMCAVKHASQVAKREGTVLSFSYRLTQCNKSKVCTSYLLKYTMLSLNAIVLILFQASGWLYKKMLQNSLGSKSHSQGLCLSIEEIIKTLSLFSCFLLIKVFFISLLVIHFQKISHSSLEKLASATYMSQKEK